MSPDRTVPIRNAGDALPWKERREESSVPSDKETVEALSGASISLTPPGFSEILVDIPIFKDLDPSALAGLSLQVSKKTFIPGEKVETPDMTVLVVLDGEIDCYLKDAANKEFFLGRSTRGDVLGELSYLVPEGADDQKVTLHAAGTVTALSMPAEAFFAAVAGNATASTALLKLMGLRLAAMNGFAKQSVDIHIDPAAIPPGTFGERIADWFTVNFGSYRFLAGCMFVSAGYIAINVFAGAWDPYPFILLNLVYSVFSAATMPVLLMSGRRQAQLDAMAARSDRLMTLEGVRLSGRIMEEVELMRREVDEMKKLVAAQQPGTGPERGPQG